MNRTLSAILFLCLYSCAAKKSTSQSHRTMADFKDSFKVAFWNVENLFDTLDDSTDDDDFTPTGYNHWSRELYDKKINNLSYPINEINADVLGLCEVENRGVLEDLKKNTPSLKYHSIVHYDSPDERGIDVAFLFNSLKFELIGSKPIKVALPAGDKTRDILEVNLIYRNSTDTITFFVNHWPSRRGGVIASNPNRFKAANELAEALKRKHNPYIVMGDLNDGPSDSSVSFVLKACKPTSNSNTCNIYDLSHLVNTEIEGTHKYHGNWDALDHIILSASLLKQKGHYQYMPNSFAIFKTNYLIQQSGKYEGYPARALAGGRFLDGYSDHLPVQCMIVYKP